MEWIVGLVSLLALAFFINKGVKSEVKELLENSEIELDGDEELGWYDWCELNTCELCDDLVLEDEAFTTIPDEDGEMLFFCEYCLNPKLK